MAKKNGWNADEMQGSLISDMEQEVKNGYQKIGQGGGDQLEEAMSKPFSNRKDLLDKDSIRESSEKVKELLEKAGVPAAIAIGNGEPTQNINVPIPVSLHQQLKVFAAQTKQNMKDLVVVAIKEYMDHQPK